MEDSNLTIIVIACIIAGLSLISLFLAVLVKWPRVQPTEVMALQGFGDICDVKKPGIRIIWPWQNAFFFPTIQVSVNIPAIQESAWIFDELGNSHQIAMEVAEASIDLKVPKNLSVAGAQAYFDVRGSLFTVVEEVKDKNGSLKGLIASAGEFLKDDVGAAIRRRWADPNRPYHLIRRDKGGLARAIMTTLKGAHQEGCERERQEYLRNVFDESCQQVRQEIEFEWSQRHGQIRPADPDIDGDDERFKNEENDLLDHYNDLSTWAEEELRDQIYSQEKDNWGVEIIGVTVKNIRAADPEMEKTLQTPAKASFEMEAELIQARKRVAIAEQGVLEAEQHAHAQAHTLQIRGAAMVEHLGLSKNDGSLADWMIRQDGIQAVRDGWSSGGGVVVADGLLSRLMGGRAS